MLNSKAFAHAATIITAVFYIVCWALSTLAPDFVIGVAKSWIHTLNLDTIKATTPMDLGTGIWGLITISVITWVTTYATIELYNRFNKK